MKYNKIYLNTLLLSTIIFLSACSNNQNSINKIEEKTTIKKKINIKIEEIDDLINLSQNPSNYTKNLPSLKFNIQSDLDSSFNKVYFRPWDLEKLTNSIDDATWGNMYASRKMYSENHKVIPKEWFDIQILNSNFKEYNTTLKKAITTNNSNLRVFPTHNAMFLDPQKAGEGFPFDYNQNSSIKINTPIFISHFSKDKAWVFVESNFATGWLNTKDIAYIDEVLIKKFKSGTYFVATEDNFPIYKNGIFLDYIKLGTIFPLRKNKFVTINKHANLEGYLSYVKIPNEYVQKKPLKFNKENINNISESIISERYGWGGIMGNRDCSAMTKDFFTPFGIYLERNSFGQTKRGTYIKLNDLSNEEKKKEIIEKGIPFLTLVYVKGHIMLYIGQKDGEPLIFHNVWGIKTIDDNGEDGRFIIGRAVITTLEPGKELPNYAPDKNILAKIEGIVLLNKESVN